MQMLQIKTCQIEYSSRNLNNGINNNIINVKFIIFQTQFIFFYVKK